MKHKTNYPFAVVRSDISHFNGAERGSIIGRYSTKASADHAALVYAKNSGVEHQVYELLSAATLAPPAPPNPVWALVSDERLPDSPERSGC